MFKHLCIVKFFLNQLKKRSGIGRIGYDWIQSVDLVNLHPINGVFVVQIGISRCNVRIRTAVLR